jgi:hypothetical protein
MAVTREPAVERLRSGRAPLLLYPLLALLSFPTLGLLLFGRDALVYAHDSLDIPRTGVPGDWLTYGLTLWNTHLTSGNALLVQQAIGPFAIDIPLAAVFGAFSAFVIDGWLLAAVAGISMHLFLRDSLRLSTPAVLGGAILFTFSYWHPIIGFAVPATPLLLWLLDRALRPSRVRWRFVLAHAVVGAAILYNGQSQIVVLVAILEAAYLLATDRRPRDERLGALGMLVGAWALSLCAYAPVVFSQLIALPDSQRTLWTLGPIPIGEILRSAAGTYNAVLLGVPVASAGRSATIYGTFFPGVVGLPLLALGVLLGGGDRRRRFLVVLLFAIPLLDIGVSLIRPIQDHAGFLKSFQLDRVRHLLPVPLAVVAALGLDRIAGALSTGQSPWPVDRWRRLLLVFSLVPGLATAAFAARGLAGHQADLLALREAGIGWLLAVIALTIGLALVAVGIVELRRGAGAALHGLDAGRMSLLLLLLLAGLVAERGTYAYSERFLGADLASWHASLDPTPAQQFLLAQPGIATDRVLTFGDDPNRMAAVGLEQADGYETIYPLAYHALFGALTGPQLAADPVRRGYFGGWGNRVMAFGPAVDPELVALDGVRWLYVRNAPPPDYNTWLYPTLPWTPTVPGIVERYRDASVTVYEVPTVLPRAFLAGGTSTAPDEAAVVGALSAATLDDLRGRVVVAEGRDSAALDAALAGAGTPGSAGSATIAAYTPDRVTIDVRADRAAVLVLTDTWAPGWVADVDGVRTPIERVDEAFRGVAVTAGAHRIVFAYAPGFTYVGFLLAGLASLIALGCAAALRARDRQGSAGGVVIASG